LELKSDSILAAKVKILTDCGDEEMSRWVRTARAALIPSLDEGFGLPLVEAMTLGVPSIVSDLPSFREIGDSIPEFIPADDEYLWEAAIIKFFESKTEGNRQRLRLAAYKPSPWRQHFALVDEWLTRLPRQHTASASGSLGGVLEDGGTTPSASTEFAHRKVA
jgi:glycosyltransferase involved in cell wall biosynthesis